jgi:hypothetical protein
LLISRRREAKRRALLQMLDRIPVRTTKKAPKTRVSALPLDVPAAAAAGPSGEALPQIKQ